MLFRTQSGRPMHRQSVFQIQHITPLNQIEDRDITEPLAAAFCTNRFPEPVAEKTNLLAVVVPSGAKAAFAVTVGGVPTEVQ